MGASSRQRQPLGPQRGARPPSPLQTSLASCSQRCCRCHWRRQCCLKHSCLQKSDRVAGVERAACEAGKARAHGQGQQWNVSRQVGGCRLQVSWMQGRLPGMPRQRRLPTCRLHAVWTAWPVRLDCRRRRCQVLCEPTLLLSDAVVCVHCCLGRRVVAQGWRAAAKALAHLGREWAVHSARSAALRRPHMLTGRQVAI